MGAVPGQRKVRGSLEAEVALCHDEIRSLRKTALKAIQRLTFALYGKTWSEDHAQWAELDEHYASADPVAPAPTKKRRAARSGGK